MLSRAQPEEGPRSSRAGCGLGEPPFASTSRCRPSGASGVVRAPAPPRARARTRSSSWTLPAGPVDLSDGSHGTAPMPAAFASLPSRGLVASPPSMARGSEGRLRLPAEPRPGPSTNCDHSAVLCVEGRASGPHLESRRAVRPLVREGRARGKLPGPQESALPACAKSRRRGGARGLRGTKRAASLEGTGTIDGVAACSTVNRAVMAAPTARAALRAGARRPGDGTSAALELRRDHGRLLARAAAQALDRPERPPRARGALGRSSELSLDGEARAARAGGAGAGGTAALVRGLATAARARGAEPRCR